MAKSKADERKITMDLQLVDAFNEQLTFERENAAFYRAHAWALENAAWDGFAKKFASQYEDEEEHAAMFAHHLIDRGEQPAVEDVQNAVGNPDPRIVCAAALAREKETTRRILALFELAALDQQAREFLRSMILEQTAEEREASDWVLMTTRADNNAAMLLLDEKAGK
jgi:ferritin